MFSYFLKFKKISIILGSSLALGLIGFIWTIGALWNVSQSIVLHFNSYIGINHLGSLWQVVALGIFCLVILGINAVVAFALAERLSLWAEIIAWANIFFALLLFIAFQVIISVN